jgi:hypothetical protein
VQAAEWDKGAAGRQHYIFVGDIIYNKFLLMPRQMVIVSRRKIFLDTSTTSCVGSTEPGIRLFLARLWVSSNYGIIQIIYENRNIQTKQK